MLKKGGPPVVTNDHREISNLFILGFYIKLQLYAEYVLFRRPLKASNLVKSNITNKEIC